MEACIFQIHYFLSILLELEPNQTWKNKQKKSSRLEPTPSWI